MMLAPPAVPTLLVRPGPEADLAPGMVPIQHTPDEAQ